MNDPLDEPPVVPPTVKLPTDDQREAAADLAGNWKKIADFIWFRESDLACPDDWALIYTHNRDSKLTVQSNAGVVFKKMRPFSECDDPDVVFETHDHWASGYVAGFSLRVYRDGCMTPAFLAYCDLLEQKDRCVHLDEADYSGRVYDATLKNIQEVVRWSRFSSPALPTIVWAASVYDWFAMHRDQAIANKDDQGGYPEEDDLRAAFTALGYLPASDSPAPAGT